MSGEKFEERERFDGQKVKILMPTYAPSPDEDTYTWRKNIAYVNVGEETKPVNRYLTSAERYFYAEEGFGSEKRKNPA
jgi:hypothetical protein